jgi:hypothetical protein
MGEGPSFKGGFVSISEKQGLWRTRAAIGAKPAKNRHFERPLFPVRSFSAARALFSLTLSAASRTRGERARHHPENIERNAEATVPERALDGTGDELRHHCKAGKNEDVPWEGGTSSSRLEAWGEE